MQPVISVDGWLLLDLFSSATDWLSEKSSYIDSLNVFPVPDGDTGSNMHISMCRALEETRNVSDGSIESVSRAFAEGALTGAHGNSGVILSQIWNGLAFGLAGKTVAMVTDFEVGLNRASLLAFQAVRLPVEGTVLTAIRDIVENSGSTDGDFTSFLTGVVETAKRSVLATRELLPVLKRSGVVDAGALGLAVIFEGMLRKFRTDLDLTAEISLSLQKGLDLTFVEDEPFRYCTEFVVEGGSAGIREIRTWLEDLGGSLIVAGTGPSIRVHVHTSDPDTIVQKARSWGDVSRISIQDMDSQRKEFRLGTEAAERREAAVVAIVDGEGLADVFRSLGAELVLSGDEVQVFDAKVSREPGKPVSAEKILLIPTSSSGVNAAERIEKFWGCPVTVVPAVTVPQGVAALVAYNQTATLKLNAANMSQAIDAVKTLVVEKTAGYAGRLEGELAASSRDVCSVIEKCFDRFDMREIELITVYYGSAVETGEAETLVKQLRRKYENCEVEFVFGGQKDNPFILSIE